ESRLLVELERIRLEQAAVKEGHFDAARAAPLYAKALGDYGVDLAAPEAAAARVRGSRLREALLAALEDWSRVTPDAREMGLRGEVLKAAEPPDAFRARWAAARRWDNVKAGTITLTRRGDPATFAKLTDEALLQELQPSVVVNMARDLESVKELASAERLLRAARERQPGDFWLNYQLGVLISTRDNST